MSMIFSLKNSARSSRSHHRSAIFLFLLLVSSGVMAACEDDDPKPDAKEVSDSTDVAELGPEWSLDQGIGPIHIYNMSMTMDQASEFNGEPMESRITSDGTIRMRKTDSSADGGETWLAIMNLATTGEAAGNTIPTMNQTQRIRYVVGPDGDIRNVAMRSEDAGMDESIQQIIQEVSERQNASQFFLKKEWAEKNPGDTWEETLTDTIDLDSVAFMGTALSGALDLRFHIRTRYTFRGKVDTLGMTMIRIDTETLEMTINGSISAESMEMQMESNGTGVGTQYFDPASRLYTVGIGEQEMDMLMKMPAMDMTLPMHQKMRMVSVRGDLGNVTPRN